MYQILCTQAICQTFPFSLFTKPQLCSQGIPHDSIGVKKKRDGVEGSQQHKESNFGGFHHHVK